MATQVTVNTKVEESIAFARDRRSLDRSVWYSGHLMTFLATAEDTRPWPASANGCGNVACG